MEVGCLGCRGVLDFGGLGWCFFVGFSNVLGSVVIDGVLSWMFAFVRCVGYFGIMGSAFWFCVFRFVCSGL